MRQHSRFCIPVLLLTFVLSSCKSSTDEPKNITPPVTAPAAPKKVEAEVKTDPTFHFTGYALTGSSDLQYLADSLGKEKMLMVLKLNRLDLKHCKSGDTLIVPINFTDSAALCPFPLHFDSAAAIPKLLVISRKVQAFAAYEHGTLLRWGPTSTGKKKTPTPAALYFTNWKKKLTHSTVDPSWILPWCVNLDNFEGISLHQFDMPGYPASHSCIRLLEEDAMWIYDWAEEWKLTPNGGSVVIYGTPTIIFDDYAYGKKPIWKKVIDDPKMASVKVSELDSVLAIHSSIIAERKRSEAVSSDSVKITGK